MIRFFNITGLKNPVGIELSRPDVPMLELVLPSRTIQPIDNQKVLDALFQSGKPMKRVDVFVINVSNVSFAVLGDNVKDLTVHALETGETWPACDVGGTPDETWPWRKIGAKTAILGWLAAQRRKVSNDKVVTPLPTMLN